MSPSPRMFRTGRPPLGALGMLTLIVLVELFVGRHRLTFMDSPDLDWQTSGRLAGSRARACDVLCFGDSMVKFGIAPRVLDATLKRPSYNLALLDGKPPASYYLLRRALSAGAKPSAVLVDFQPEMLFEPWANLGKNPRWSALMLGPAEALDLSWSYRDPDFFARLILARYFPSIRCRAQVRANVLAALDGRATPTREANAPVRRNWQVNHGGILLAKQPGYRGDVPPQMVGDLLNPAWRSEPANARYVRRFLDLASRHKVPVFWLLPPNAPEVVARRTESGVFGRYDAFVREALARFENLTVIDARRSGYAHTVFVDPVHLDRQGAAALSADVAGVLRRAIAPGASTPRWVVLPPYHEPTVPLALEDVEQSKTALKLEDVRARR